MSELNRENIIKALEYCGTSYSCNEKCPFVPNTHKGSLGCSEELMLAALALIKELIEENDRLKLSLSAIMERSESRKEADISEILELRLKVEEVFEEIEEMLNLQAKIVCETRDKYSETDKPLLSFIAMQDGRIYSLRVVEEHIAELKKKYIGDKQRKEDEGE